VTPWRSMGDEMGELARERDEARAEVSRLTAIVLRYGKHEWWCDTVERHFAACSCGFAEAIEPIKQKGTP
jgi:hypothetical protein